MATSKAKTPEPPRGFEKGQRAMAMIIHAVLDEMGCSVGYLNTPGAGDKPFTIGIIGTDKVVVTYEKPPRMYAQAKSATENLTRRINAKLRGVTSAAGNLAAYDYNSGYGGAGPWHSVIVQVPGLLVMRRLHSHFVKK